MELLPLMKRLLLSVVAAVVVVVAVFGRPLQ